MDGKDIDRFIKDSIETSTNTPHPDSPDHDKNWALIEQELEQEPKKKRTWLYVAAAAIALLLFSNFYWMLEQRSYSEQITAIVFKYEKELAKEPPATLDPEPAPEPAIAPKAEPVTDPQTPPEPEVKIVYVDRFIEVPVEVPVYVQPVQPSLTEAQQSEVENPELTEITTAEPTVQEPDREDLIPPSRIAPRKKKKANKPSGQRSFGLKLALNQKR